MIQPEQFVFKTRDDIGAAAAEDDKFFLAECFVDTGDLGLLRDPADHRRLVLGRTGSGKTALLLKLAALEERAIVIEPESLALQYVSNSTILNFLSALGVKFDIFFRLLWRHVFTVEIIRAHFNINSESASHSVLTRLRGLFRDKSDLEALAYLEKWGRSFWEETDYRIKELTSTLERKIKGEVGGNFKGLALNLEGARTLTTEQKQEIVERAQRVVNEVQIRELSQIMELLDKVLDDPQKRYYLLIDRLDENWVDDGIRYRLVRALIETARDFMKIENAKIIVALREDLCERVFRLTRDAGFQEEKYRSLYLLIQWSRSELADVLDERINILVRKRYTTERVRFHQLLPKRVDLCKTLDYLLDRTFMRPRDVILFFNEIIIEAANNAIISEDMIRKAERRYSRLSLRALADEWFSDYPNLFSFVSLLKEMPVSFRLAEVSQSAWDEYSLNIVAEGNLHDDALSRLAGELVEGSIPTVDFLRRVICLFYKVGLVGLKIEAFESVNWVYEGHRTISTSEISEQTQIQIHPRFWRVLGNIPRTVYEKRRRAKTTSR